MQPNPPQPDPPQHGYPQYGQAPMAGGPAPWAGGPPTWGGGPIPPAPPTPKANAVAAMTAGILALLAAAMFVWFALYNVAFANGPAGAWSSVLVVNVAGGLLGAVVLVVPACFTLARKVPGAWALCAVCALYVVAVFVTAPLLFGTPFGTHLHFLFAFHDGNGIALSLATVLGVLTAIAAAVAGSVTSRGPAIAAPPRP